MAPQRGALPDDEQDPLAALILAEIEDTRRWDEHFADGRSPAILERLAAEARVEGEARLTEPLEELMAEVEEETPEPPQTRGCRRAARSEVARR